MEAMKKTHATFDEILRELSNGQLDPEVIRKPVTAESYASVVADSRKALAGSIFCAIKGISQDGHKLIADLGPLIGIAIVEDTTSEFGKGSCGIVKVKSTRAAWAQLASFFSGHPSRQLTMIGITGTNGKTSMTLFPSKENARLANVFWIKSMVPPTPE
jgi:UDP-N-acetylmuramyl tripeptide synthase